MEKIIYNPIGVIKTPFKTLEHMPIQPTAGKGVRGFVHMDKKYVEGLDDLAGFSHICLFYHFHASTGYKLKIVPFLDNQLRGVFSTRAPKRPNSIGLSVVKLITVEENILTIEDLDILDGTPLLDIKPFIPQTLPSGHFKIGWLEPNQSKMKSRNSDQRFK